ncbi:hypothetical protein BGZ54_003558 [Gamsiella multidivaricata]|nr:hypothetical protein BGZ54_003558 [Gamsiella multidivaricata]
MDSVSADSQRASSIKSLMVSIQPPASPLDALVLALEATVEEMKECNDQDQPFRALSTLQEQDDEEDPNATVPSSPTFFMKKSSTLPSLHQLPSLVLPEAATSSLLSLPSSADTVAPIPPATFNSHSPSSSSGLTPSTHPGQTASRRKMSICSQGSMDSLSSANSSGERIETLVCSVRNCSKKFYQVAHLRIHERCHTGTRPFVCRYDGCERSFTQLGNLKTHERKHTGERPFKCPYPGCDKTFTQLGNLKTHERIHDEVKPFMCRLTGCGKTFSQLGNLKTHTAKMHPDMSISDEEMAIKSATSPSHSAQDRTERSTQTHRIKEQGHRQVIAYFNPYQRRPIHPQRSERDVLIKDISTILQHQERALDLALGSELSDDMEE